jgi:DNA-binding NarL/FixJ family response regulator
MAIRVLVAEDQPVVRAGIAMLLNTEPDIEVVGTAGDGAEAIEQARLLQPDVVVMDVRMPGTDGVAATRHITDDTFSENTDRPIKILILTTYNLDEAVHAAIRAGASGFLLKDAIPGELVRAIHAIAAGDGWLDPTVTRQLLKEFAARPQPLKRTGEEIRQLTAREREVFILVGHGLSNSEIAGRLFISEATVKTHLGRVLTKLGLRDRPQAIVAAYQNRLITLDSNPR